MYFLAILWLSSAYQMINGNIPTQNPIYLSSKLSLFHRNCAESAIDKLNEYSFLTSTHFSTVPEYNHNTIRISYYSPFDYYARYTGSTEFTGVLNSLNEWDVKNIVININEEITDLNTCLFIIMHEICHSRGLFHSNDIYSIMNMSVSIFDNQVVPFVGEPYLGVDDILGLQYISNQNQS